MSNGFHNVPPNGSPSSTRRSSLFGENVSGEGSFTFDTSYLDRGGPSRRVSAGAIEGRARDPGSNGIGMETAEAAAKRRKVQVGPAFLRVPAIRAEGHLSERAMFVGERRSSVKAR